MANGVSSGNSNKKHQLILVLFYIEPVLNLHIILEFKVNNEKKEVQHMYLKCSLGFIIGSLIQASIIMFTENVGISNLGVNLTANQFVIHIFTGQLAGFILLLILRKAERIQRLSFTTIGIVYGLILWSIVLPFNASRGKVNLPWEAGGGTVISSLFVFIVFGVIAAFTIKRYGNRSAQPNEFKIA